MVAISAEPTNNGVQITFHKQGIIVTLNDTDAKHLERLLKEIRYGKVTR